MREGEEGAAKAAGAWSLPPGVNVVLIDNEEQLDSIRHVCANPPAGGGQRRWPRAAASGGGQAGSVTQHPSWPAVSSPTAVNCSTWPWHAAWTLSGLQRRRLGSSAVAGHPMPREPDCGPAQTAACCGAPPVALGASVLWVLHGILADCLNCLCLQVSAACAVAAARQPI